MVDLFSSEAEGVVSETVETLALVETVALVLGPEATVVVVEALVVELVLMPVLAELEVLEPAERKMGLLGWMVLHTLASQAVEAVVQFFFLPRRLKPPNFTLTV